jgi:hypothetical protein
VRTSFALGGMCVFVCEKKLITPKTFFGEGEKKKKSLGLAHKVCVYKYKEPDIPHIPRDSTLGFFPRYFFSHFTPPLRPSLAFLAEPKRYCAPCPNLRHKGTVGPQDL